MAGGLKNMNLSQYRSWMQKRIEFLTHAQRGFPEERIRFHTFYGVNFGPRLSDLQLDHVMLTIKAGAYSFEAANPGHDHEWRVARKFRVPEGKILISGRPILCRSRRSAKARSASVSLVRLTCPMRRRRSTCILSQATTLLFWVFANQPPQ